MLDIQLSKYPENEYPISMISNYSWYPSIWISKKVVNPLILTCIWWCRVRSKSVLAEVLTPILTLSSSRGMRGTFVEDFRSGVELKPPFLRPPPLFMTWLCRSAWLVCCFEVGESSAEFDFLDACNWKI